MRFLRPEYMTRVAVYAVIGVVIIVIAVVYFMKALMNVEDEQDARKGLNRQERADQLDSLE